MPRLHGEGPGLDRMARLVSFNVCSADARQGTACSRLNFWFGRCRRTLNPATTAPAPGEARGPVIRLDPGGSLPAGTSATGGRPRSFRTPPFKDIKERRLSEERSVRRADGKGSRCLGNGRSPTVPAQSTSWGTP
jgi:hypothetical protein